MADARGAFVDAARAREAVLAQRLATSVELDRSFEGIVRGAHQYNLRARGRLDVLEADIRQAAATWPGLDTPAGSRQFQTYLAGKTREIHKIVTDAAADSAQRAAQVQALTGRYPLGKGRRPKDTDHMDELMTSKVVTGLPPHTPQGTRVFCVPGVSGGPYAYECLVVYPDGTNDIYHTDDDESGFFGP